MAGWGSQLQLFQIGDMSFHGHALSYHGEQIQSRGKTEEMITSYKMAMPDSSFLIKPRKYKMKLQIFSNELYGSGQFIQKFKSLIGKVTDIFAYEVIRDNPDKIVCGCPMCSCCTCELFWLHNRGRITDISVKSKDYMSFTADISIEVQSYWKPINRLIWEWKPIGAVSRFEEDWEFDMFDRISQYPNCDRFANGGSCNFWYKRCRPNLSDLYDPNFFSSVHCYHSSTYPPTGYTSLWSTIVDRHFININNWQWSAPPLSQYYFDTLTALSGDITITAESMDGQCERTCVTTVVLATLTSELAAAGIVLVDTDVLVIGDAKGMAHIMRNNEIIVYVSPAVSFTCGSWPGQLLPGNNAVEIDPQGARHAMHHYFRRL